MFRRKLTPAGAAASSLHIVDNDSGDTLMHNRFLLTRIFLSNGRIGSAAGTRRKIYQIGGIVLMIVLLSILMLNPAAKQNQSTSRQSERSSEKDKTDISDSMSAPSTQKVAKEKSEKSTRSVLRPITETCKDVLVHNQAAIQANISLPEKVEFSILLFPLNKDKYISAKILKSGLYEKEMGDFISRALPLASGNGKSSPSTASGKIKDDRPWAVDIGANVGFHSLHMAKRGARVISFEPAPDTSTLLKCSIDLLDANSDGRATGDTSFDNNSTMGSITLIKAGASDVRAMGKMSRHPDSPGMTTFGGATSSFPLEELGIDKNSTSRIDSTGLESEANGIPLVRVEDILIEHGLPENDPGSLRLLKVDAEGFELRALQGFNLTRFPFKFLTFEFFPKMLRGSGQSDPVDLLILVRNAGYKCDTDEKVGSTRKEMNEWVNKIRRHENIYCQLRESSD